jgi:5-methylcytosine-specific restriction endonuclease McrA
MDCANSNTCASKAEKIHRQKYMKRNVPLKRTGFKTKKKAKKKTVKRTKLPTVKSMRNKCDKLLTPIIKVMQPNCLLCGGETQVAHHHIKKSTSSALRYYIPNLIGLCTPCHCRLHNDEILWTGRVIKLKGMEWLEDLEEKKKEQVKTDVHFYIEHYERLSKYDRI